MYRRFGVIAVLLAVAAGFVALRPASAQDAPWKGKTKIIWINKDRPGDYIVVAELKFEGKVENKKVTVKLEATESLSLRGAEVKDNTATVDGKSIALSLVKPGGDTKFSLVAYEKDGKVFGSLDNGNRRFPVRLDPSDEKPAQPPKPIADLFTQALKEKPEDRPGALNFILKTYPNDDSVKFGVSALLFQAAAQAAMPDAAKVGELADAYIKAHERYGREMEIAARLWIASELVRVGKLGAAAEKYALEAQAKATAEDPTEVTLPLYRLLVPLLEKSAGTDEMKLKALKAAKERLAALETGSEKVSTDALAAGLAAAGLKVEPIARADGAKDRAVLVELFTGAESPGSAATELAVQQLLLNSKAKPTDLVVVAYHLNVPDADPLSSKAADVRAGAMGVVGVPKVFVDGAAQKKTVFGAFPFDADAFAAVKNSYTALRADVDARLGEKPGAKIDLKVSAKDGEIKVSAELGDLPDALGDLRFYAVLVEESHKYTGQNGVRVHYNFARAFIGGDDGFEVKKEGDTKVAKIAETAVKVADVKKALTDYFNPPAPAPKIVLEPGVSQALELKKLKVVAFVQDKKTKKVLQAAEKAVVTATD